MRFLLGLILVAALFTSAAVVSADSTPVGDNGSAVTQVAEFDMSTVFETEDYQPMVESYTEVSLATCCESVTTPVAHEKRNNRRVDYMYRTTTNFTRKGSWNGCDPIHQWMMS